LRGSAISIAADEDGWMLLAEFSHAGGAGGDAGEDGGGACAGTTHALIRLDRELRPRGEPALVFDQTDPKGSDASARRGFGECRLVPWGERWLAVAAVQGRERADVCQLGLLELIPEIPALRNVRWLTDNAAGYEATDVLSVADGAAILLVSSRGPTAVLRFDAEAETLTLAAFHDAPYLARDLGGGGALVDVGSGDGFLALVHDVVKRGGIEPETILHRFARYDRSLRMTHLSHPFLLGEGRSAGTSGLARRGETLALVSREGGETRVATLDIDVAVALMAPVERLAPGGVHAFALPDGVLEAVQRQATAAVAEMNEFEVSHLPVLRPEDVIAEMGEGKAGG
jgi:hypothetical protein